MSEILTIILVGVIGAFLILVFLYLLMEMIGGDKRDEW